MSVSEMKLELAKLDKIKDDLSYLVGEVNDKTREIKYLDTPSNIYLAVEMLAEDNGVDISYEVDKVREKVNELESAIYELVTPFEDKAREAENAHDDLECEIYEEVHCA
jgi:hypothetical protein|tara:strand:- start:162 stop:488 length:327 start_codon:yes stop_codon:yes gene_type:complete